MKLEYDDASNEYIHASINERRNLEEQFQAASCSGGVEDETHRGQERVAERGRRVLSVPLRSSYTPVRPIHAITAVAFPVFCLRSLPTTPFSVINVHSTHTCTSRMHAHVRGRTAVTQTIDKSKSLALCARCCRGSDGGFVRLQRWIEIWVVLESISLSTAFPVWNRRVAIYESDGIELAALAYVESGFRAWVRVSKNNCDEKADECDRIAFSFLRHYLFKWRTKTLMLWILQRSLRAWEKMAEN